MTKGSLEAKVRVAQFVQGPMLEAYSQLIPSTIQNAREVNRDRIDNPSIRNQGVWTADSLLYDAEGNGEFLYVADKKQNLIFKNIAEATNQLRKTGNYAPKREDAQPLKIAKATVKIRLSELELTADGNEWGYFEIETDNYKTSNKARMKMTEAIYGKGKESDANMEMLRGEKIKKAIVYVLLPEYVKQKVDELKRPIVRAAGLGWADVGSWFDAVGRLVDVASLGLRGVRKGSAEGAPKKIEINPYEAAYQTLLKDPNAAAKSITPIYQAGIADILARSLRQKA